MTGKRQRAHQLAMQECIRCQHARGFRKNADRLCLGCQYPESFLSTTCADCGRDMVVPRDPQNPTTVRYCTDCGARRFVPGYAKEVMP